MINWERLAIRLKDCERRFSGNRLKVLKRDNWTCQICGKNFIEHNIRFVVHHKDGKGFHKYGKNANNSMNNLISLCNGCHIRMHKTITKKCKIEGCDNRANFGRGLCHIHYKRMYFQEAMNNPVKKKILQKKQSEYQNKNREKVNERVRDWNKRNPEKRRAAYQKYNSKKKAGLI